MGTAVLSITTIEKLIHRLGHQGSGTIEPLTRYSCRRFRAEALLAEPQPLEVLDFRTDRDSYFDGVHMHLFVDLDGISQIDVLKLQSGPDDSSKSSWNTTYVRLLEEPMMLCSGSRIVFACNVDLEASLASYSISVSVGDIGSERHVASFEWRGG